MGVLPERRISTNMQYSALIQGVCLCLKNLPAFVTLQRSVMHELCHQQSDVAARGHGVDGDGLLATKARQIERSTRLRTGAA